MFTHEMIKSFNQLEMDVYNYIISNEEKVVYMKVRELAEEVHVSTTTILRFCKKVGCEGYSEFRLKLKQEVNSKEQKKINMDLTAVKDFFERGYYKEREKHYQVAKCGKISWRKTIKTQKSVIQDNEAYYLNFVVKNNNMNENELITLVHKYCVYQSFDKFGWLFTSYVPEKPRIGLTNKMMISVVMNKLQNTFTDQNKQLFKNMLATLKKLDDEDQKEFRYGTYKFEYVWEKMIDKVFGISQKVDYFPKTTWSLAGGKLHDNAFLEPDSIMLYAGKVYVLDAKYYKYGWSGAPGHLPQSTSINKQITYGEYIANADKFTKNGKRPAVYNAFLMPYDSKGKKFPTEKPIHYIGTATSDWKSGSEKYENVIGLLIDMKYLMELNGRQDMSEISQLAALIEQFCPV